MEELRQVLLSRGSLPRLPRIVELFQLLLPRRIHMRCLCLACLEAQPAHNHRHAVPLHIRHGVAHLAYLVVFAETEVNSDFPALVHAFHFRLLET